jgi:alpha-amylase/alpha-mannosidase (GH57 family)
LAKRYVCVHGHFYQPPRENPWLEAVEQQDSAAPHHDWNERITDECYRPNTQSRILDGEGWIERIVNNYARISFNFGPTLMSWLEHHAPDVHDAVVEADRLSLDRFGGCGSALAQPYNHMIMPLANRRDRLTQLRWGIEDFRYRFGREPEGMWLPEAAANTATLEDLAAHGIAFTVLAPRQAKRFRQRGASDWTDCRSAGIDPSRAYACTLPSGRSIALFFYDGPISQAVAFERLLNNGNHFASRLLDALSDARDWPQLAHIATDGETYGHHHRYGDMALAVALQAIENDPAVELTNYARFLELHPPKLEVEIHDDSSWSCIHGVERWRSDCGCNALNRHGWNQKYRKPLRDALDNLRDRLGPLFQSAAVEYLSDPWAARDEYIRVINDRSEESLRAFLERHAIHPLHEQARVRVLHLLEMQRHAMLMYTSCGWFFDDISGIEAVQVLLYAARAIQIAESVFGREFEADFLLDLDKAPSNIPELRSGREVYERYVAPAKVDLPRVGAHYAVASLFKETAGGGAIYCYQANSLGERSFNAGRTRMVVGRVRLTSDVTRDSESLSYAVLHAGDHIISGGARKLRGDHAFDELVDTVATAFDNGDIAGIIHAMEAEFGTSSFSLGSLFKDEQRRIAQAISRSAIVQVESVYSSLHEQHQALLRYLSGLGIPIPRPLLMPSQFVTNHKLTSELMLPNPDMTKVLGLVRSARRESIPLDGDLICFRFEACVSRLAQRLLSSPQAGLLERLWSMLDVAEELPNRPNLARAQLAIYRLLHERGAGPSDPAAVELLNALATRLRIRAQQPAAL